MKKYELIDKRLHEEDVKKAVKTHNWEYVINTITEFFSDKDSGRFGKIFEIIIKLYLNGYKGNSCVVSPKGKVDVTYHGKKCEVKSNCGQLDIEDIVKKDVVIYSLDNTSDIYNPERAKVFYSDDFINELEKIGLLRQDKKCTDNNRRTAIQSYRNSKKKMSMWQLANDKQISLDTWANTIC